MLSPFPFAAEALKLLLENEEGRREMAAPPPPVSWNVVFPVAPREWDLVMENLPSDPTALGMHCANVQGLMKQFSDVGQQVLPRLVEEWTAAAQCNKSFESQRLFLRNHFAHTVEIVQIFLWITAKGSLATLALTGELIAGILPSQLFQLLWNMGNILLGCFHASSKSPDLGLNLRDMLLAHSAAVMQWQAISHRLPTIDARAIPSHLASGLLRQS